MGDDGEEIFFVLGSMLSLVPLVSGFRCSLRFLLLGDLGLLLRRSFLVDPCRLS